MNTQTEPRRPLNLAEVLGPELQEALKPALSPASHTPASPATTDASKPRHPLLTTRQTTHGSFADNARVSQSLKEIFRNQPGWSALTDIERESMDMIALKFSRILSGKSMEKQHWEDVVGYAKLVEELCA